MKITEKESYLLPEDILEKIMDRECQRLGGIIRDKAGKIVFKLTDKASPDEYCVLTIRKPSFMECTLGATTYEVLKNTVKKYPGNFFLPMKDLEDKRASIIKALALLQESGVVKPFGEVLQALKILEEGNKYFLEQFDEQVTKYDSIYFIQSFPTLFLVMVTGIALTRAYLLEKNYTVSLEWLNKICGCVLDAMKKYCLLVSEKTVDHEHYRELVTMPADRFKEGLKDVFLSPAGQPKIKFPPMEVVYLWNCSEFLEGYLLEVGSMQ